MVQTEGDQGALQQAIDKGACITGSQHQRAQRRDAILHHRPDIEHGNADDQIHSGADDGHKTGAAEECQHLRQLDLIELIVQRCHTQTDHDAAEHAHLQGSDAQHGSGGVGGHGVHAAGCVDHSLNGRIHNEISHRTGQGRDLFFLAGHADGNAHSEQQRQVVEHCVAGPAHHIQDGIDQGSLMDHAVQLPMPSSRPATGSRAMGSIKLRPTRCSTPKILSFILPFSFSQIISSKFIHTQSRALWRTRIYDKT